MPVDEEEADDAGVVVVTALLAAAAAACMALMCWLFSALKLCDLCKDVVVGVMECVLVPATLLDLFNPDLLGIMSVGAIAIRNLSLSEILTR